MKRTNYHLLVRWGFSILLALTIIQACEKRELYLEEVSYEDIAVVREKFLADSILFVRSGMEVQQSFRQRLHRQVHWERANRYEDGRYFIPVTLRLTTDSDSLFNGTSAIFPHRVTLMIEESDQGFNYTMLTFLPSDRDAGKFTGTLLHEGYFLGHTMFSDYVDNQPVRRTGIQTVQSQRDLKMSQVQGSGGGGCDWVYIHTICVGGDGGTNPEDCWDHYEWLCEGEGPDMPDEEYDPGDDTGSGDGPGDGGSGPGEDPAPSEHKENDECEGVAKANDLKSLAGLQTTINNIVSSPTEIGHHFYLSNKTDPSSMYIGPANTSGSSSNWPAWYTWDATNGYAIGSIHNHPNQSAPSPSDALAGIEISVMKSNIPAEVDFVTKNNITVVVTNSYIYTITIKDAVAFEGYQNAYNASKVDEYLDYADEYINLINPNATQQERGEYALLKMYGDAINLTKRSTSGTDNALELKLNNSNQQVTLVDPCN